MQSLWIFEYVSAFNPGQQNVPVQGSTKAVTPDSLALIQVARFLTRAGGKIITPEMVEKDIRSGAPANGDGTENLVH
ncbi:MAG: hypothetical protein ACK517_03035 [bacterium]